MKSAIQAAVVLLTKSAKDLARWTHAAKKLHDESVSAADGLRAVDARITQLESKLAAETERLDFVLRKYAYCAKFSDCVSPSGRVSSGYQLIVSDEELDCITLSGEDINHPTPRAAIDAAIALAKGSA